MMKEIKEGNNIIGLKLQFEDNSNIPENKKHAGGRPLLFSTVEELETLIQQYFESCWSHKVDMFGKPIYLKDKSGADTDTAVMVQIKPYTISGLAVALGTSRQTLMNYEEKDKFVDTIKRAKEKCEAYAEESLFIGKNQAGAIFNLKNNYINWKDKTETDLTSDGKPIAPNVTMNITPPYLTGGSHGSSRGY